ncbi:methyl-accepting chemotaxis protein [Undibacterium sp. SXout7W]|uniref:methyl-accepting chemotaxis protein n=1 Tax=Undibacterium sp. SXout7W TaxID=3413049 RepID=UPI003BEFA3DB
MRNNQPVTGVETIMRDGQSIVSTTDLKGNITYCNPYFIEISGFEEEELIGAPQNIVRHPDMPKEAFADLWETIKSGMSWTGLVKNRCKDGSHYWVNANVTPVIESGNVVGYMSVRTKPSRADIVAADALYTNMRNGTAGKVKLHHGKLISTTWLGRLKASMRMPASTKLATSMTIILLIVLTWGVLDIRQAGVTVFNITGLVLSVFVVLYLWHFVQNKLIAPIHNALLAAQSMAGGDLTRQMAAGDESEMGQLIQALRQMNVNMVSIIGDVRSNVQSISVGTREIADGNMDLSGRTESQASSLQETAASMEEFTSTVRQNFENANEANKLASATSAVALKGGEVVARVGVTMHEISDSAKHIENIISLIDGIAFQTNILALNAAVEAARAGEQGRGFAVVASEVRNLAQRSASAAKEIKALIDDSASKVETGNKLVEEASKTMSELVDSVQHVTHLIHEISAASSEQSDGVDQMSSAITHIDEVTQQNAAMVEEAAASAANLADQASRLQKAVSVFKLDNAKDQRIKLAVVMPKRATRTTAHALADHSRKSGYQEE